MDIGDDVSWYLDMSQQREDGEAPVVGWISGLPVSKQPEWLKKEEYFPTFEDFFAAKVKAQTMDNE